MEGTVCGDFRGSGRAFGTGGYPGNRGDFALCGGTKALWAGGYAGGAFSLVGGVPGQVSDYGVPSGGRSLLPAAGYHGVCGQRYDTEPGSHGKGRGHALCHGQFRKHRQVLRLLLCDCGAVCHRGYAVFAGDGWVEGADGRIHL